MRLPGEAREIIRSAGLTERHARAVLRLPAERRIPALRHIAAEGMNVATAERYIERLLSEKKHRARHAGVIKDIRLFYENDMRFLKQFQGVL